MGYFVVGIICLMAGATFGAVVVGLCKSSASADTKTELNLERDYWRREAIKNAAKLGEIRILAEQTKQAEA